MDRRSHVELMNETLDIAQFACRGTKRLLRNIGA